MGVEDDAGDAAPQAETVYPAVNIEGSPFEMGRSHGRQLHDRVRVTVAVMREAIGHDAYDAGWDAFQPTVAHCRAAVPDLVAEMEGIAEGAGLPFKDIWLINAHLDLSVWKRKHWETGTAGELPGCLG